MVVLGIELTTMSVGLWAGRLTDRRTDRHEVSETCPLLMCWSCVQCWEPMWIDSSVGNWTCNQSLDQQTLSVWDLYWMSIRHRSSNPQPHPAALPHLWRFETPDMAQSDGCPQEALGTGWDTAADCGLCLTHRTEDPAWPGRQKKKKNKKTCPLLDTLVLCVLSASVTRAIDYVNNSCVYIYTAEAYILTQGLMILISHVNEGFCIGVAQSHLCIYIFFLKNVVCYLLNRMRGYVGCFPVYVCSF